MNPSLHTSSHPPTCIYISKSFIQCPHIHPSTYMYLYIHPRSSFNAHTFIHPSIHLHVHVFTHPSTLFIQCPHSIHPSIHLPIPPPTCIYTSIHILHSILTLHPSIHLHVFTHPSTFFIQCPHSIHPSIP